MLHNTLIRVSYISGVVKQSYPVLGVMNPAVNASQSAQQVFYRYPRVRRLQTQASLLLQFQATFL